jgi:hypothetical protein
MCFAKHFHSKYFCVLNQNTLCFAIHLTIVITSVPTVVQIIVSTKDDLHPHATVGTMLALSSLLPWLPPLSPPLPRLPRCRRHCHRRHCRCHCHGCCHLHRHQHRFCCYFLPSHCLSFRHRCLPPPLPLLAVNAIATVAAAANRCPLLLPP